MQIQFNCCGALNGSQSWEPLRPIRVPIGAYPLSCCMDDAKYGLENQWCDEQQVQHRESCIAATDQMVSKVSNSLQITIDITIEAAIVQLLCIVSATVSQNFNRDYVGVAYSPYTKHWVGQTLPYWNSYTLEDIVDMLNVVNSRFRSIATYGMGVAGYNVHNKWDQTDSNCLVSRAAATINHNKNQMALQVWQGINQNEDQTLQQTEINNAFSAAQDANGIYGNTVKGLIFTNEYFTSEATGNRILNMITSNKNRAHQMNVKVGTRIHVCGLIQGSGAMHDILANIVRESDFIMCNVYPDNNVVKAGTQQSVDAVGNAFLSYRQKFKEINANIEVMIGETGWPSQGISFNASPNNVKNLRDYWTQMGDWADRNKVLVHMFEAIDLGTFSSVCRFLYVRGSPGLPPLPVIPTTVSQLWPPFGLI
ncbi:unnamed protein product [Oppiella nova]|uniref:glucan endo-1,3-beta-D-glucosidase n=1 Tax=Oppiella nova TaxID=334625 RepID=A0A7R9LF11_9ACAR|nr:unnamed protein product [Oppiella nova]CAG2163011.1 unnamed protein product [Oppiella nova]